jgi:hypothetical protein
MRQIIYSVYGALLIAIWICVMGIIVAVFDSGGPNWLLAAAGFVAATITVTLVEEFIEWRSRPSTTKSALDKEASSYFTPYWCTRYWFTGGLKVIRYCIIRAMVDNFFASSCDNRRPIIAFGTYLSVLPSSS